MWGWGMGGEVGVRYGWKGVLVMGGKDDVGSGEI